MLTAEKLKRAEEILRANEGVAALYDTECPYCEQKGTARASGWYRCLECKKMFIFEAEENT